MLTAFPKRARTISVSATFTPDRQLPPVPGHCDGAVRNRAIERELDRVFAIGAATALSASAASGVRDGALLLTLRASRSATSAREG
jgi:hypothetical protein